jgi:hypothetical protein
MVNETAIWQRQPKEVERVFKKSHSNQIKLLNYSQSLIFKTKKLQENEYGS